MNSYLSAAQALAPIIAARAEDIEQARRLPADLARQMAEADLFRLTAPADIGGPQCAPALVLEIIETIARADASAGWAVMIGVTTAMNGAYLPRDVARDIFGARGVIASGVFAPMGRAQEDGDDYIVSGRWQWASNSANSDWLSGGCVLMSDGAPKKLANGALETRMMFFQAAQAELIDSWRTSGLCGTGSGETSVENIRVPKRYSVSLVTDRPRVQDVLYAFPIFGFLALGVAAVSLGAAQASIEDLVALAGGKKPQGSSRALAERASAQAALAEATARLRAARAFYYEAVANATQIAARAGEVDAPLRAELRLAAAHAARTGADVTRAMYDLGGGSSVFLSSPLQRRFRDAHVATQHMMVAPQIFELAGRVLMGLPTDASFL
jgi:alkylation response protein AidB-like acyl-CoA dehydrogenase